MTTLILGLTAWALMSIPFGILFGKMFRRISRDYQSHSAPFEPVIRKQSWARRFGDRIRAALFKHRSSVQAGD